MDLILLRLSISTHIVRVEFDLIMSSPSPSSDPPFQLLSSLRYDPLLLSSPENNSIYRTTPTPFYMLQYHKDRLIAAAQHFGWKEAHSKLKGRQGLKSLEESLLEAVSEQLDPAKYDPDTPLKVPTRVGLYTSDGRKCC